MSGSGKKTSEGDTERGGDKFFRHLCVISGKLFGERHHPGTQGQGSRAVKQKVVKQKGADGKLPLSTERFIFPPCQLSYELMKKKKNLRIISEMRDSHFLLIMSETDGGTKAGHVIPRAK